MVSRRVSMGLGQPGRNPLLVRRSADVPYLHCGKVILSWLLLDSRVVDLPMAYHRHWFS